MAKVDVASLFQLDSGRAIKVERVPVLFSGILKEFMDRRGCALVLELDDATEVAIMNDLDDLVVITHRLGDPNVIDQLRSTMQGG